MKCEVCNDTALWTDYDCSRLWCGAHLITHIWEEHFLSTRPKVHALEAEAIEQLIETATGRWDD